MLCIWKHTKLCNKGAFLLLSLLYRIFDDQLSSHFQTIDILCICWDTPKKTGLWQLLNVSSFFRSIYCVPLFFCPLMTARCIDNALCGTALTYSRCNTDASVRQNCPAMCGDCFGKIFILQSLLIYAFVYCFFLCFLSWFELYDSVYSHSKIYHHSQTKHSATYFQIKGMKVINIYKD